MSKMIRIPFGFIKIVEIDFNCPKCDELYQEKDYSHKFNQSKTGVVYTKCKKCRESIGITLNIKGDIVVWTGKNHQRSIHFKNEKQ